MSSRVELLYKTLKLTEKIKKLAKWEPMTDEEARAALAIGTSVHPDNTDYSGVAIWGHDLRGECRDLYQVRLSNPPIGADGKPEGKYRNRKGSDGRWINTTPGALKDKDHVILVESPKSTYAVTAALERAGKKNFKVADTNGLPGWLVKKDGEESRPNADLLLLAGHKVTLAMDSNCFREDLKPLLVRLEHHLTSIGAEVDVMKVPSTEGVNGPDDLISVKGDSAFWEAFNRRQALWHYECPAVSDFDPKDIKSDLLIEHLFANKSITIFASPSENYKTMIAMCASRSLLNQTDAFECEEFTVHKTVPGVLYLCPDMSHELTILYASKFGLNKIPGRFRIRTMKQGDVLGPDHPTIIQAARAGWFIVLDTMNYFTLADDDNNPQQLNKFIQKVRRLVDIHGASGVLMLVHPTKTGAMSGEVELTQWVSGTYAKIGSVDTIFCMRKIKDESGTPLDVWISREKSRPFLGVRLEPFTLQLLDEKGKSTIDNGRLPLRKLNAGPLKDYLPKKEKGAGAPSHPKKLDIMNFIRKTIARSKEPLGRSDIWAALDASQQFNPDGSGCGVSERTIGTWLKEIRDDKNNVRAIKEEDVNG